MKRLALLWIIVVFFGTSCLEAGQKSPTSKKDYLQDFDPAARWDFDGLVGRRVDVNVESWLKRAPKANPALTTMFLLRDRQPKPHVVVWAGEFVGKYLISAVQALRMTDDAGLRATVEAVLDAMAEGQAENGYLGPFDKQQQLLGNWDLWGHYHIMQGLLMWHEQTGDPRSLAMARKMADLACKLFVDEGRSIYETAPPFCEMNFAVIHSLGRLHRLTGEPRYFELMRKIEKEWTVDNGGDFFRLGLAGVPFWQMPRPRWEALHDIQGIAELYRITGNEDYRRSYLNLWESIRDWDVHNTGGFSSLEQASGNPYKNSSIETCCTIAWMALSVDALRLSGEARVADELELATYNGMLGAQHPSGSWWTYNTPMNGNRRASFDTINFQARAGSPELNCCSVNAPRGLGMLSEWSLMRRDDGLVVNYYGPYRVKTSLADGTPLELRQETSYPLDGTIRLTLDLKQPKTFTLYLRRPGWVAADRFVVKTNDRKIDGDASTAQDGYVRLTRQWKPGDSVAIEMPLELRYESGGHEMFGRMSIYRGPVLLAYDLLLNDFDEAQLPPIGPADLRRAKIQFPPRDKKAELAGQYSPWLLVDIPTQSGRTVRLCDFATAGCRGSRYVSWLPGRELRPSPARILEPRLHAVVPPGAIAFLWRGELGHPDQKPYRLEVFELGKESSGPVLSAEATTCAALISPEKASVLKPKKTYAWRLYGGNPFGETEAIGSGRTFTIDPKQRPRTLEDLALYGENAEGVVVRASLDGSPEPRYGKLLQAKGFSVVDGPEKGQKAIQLDGNDGSMLVYAVKQFPPENYTVTCRFRLDRKVSHPAELFCAWCDDMDDPLRLFFKNGRLSACMEARTICSARARFATPDVAIEPGRWYHVAAVKRGEHLVLYLDGKKIGDCLRTPRHSVLNSIPRHVFSKTRAFALGGNPRFTGKSENLPCTVADFQLLTRPLGEEEIAALIREK